MLCKYKSYTNYYYAKDSEFIDLEKGLDLFSVFLNGIGSNGIKPVAADADADDEDVDVDDDDDTDVAEDESC